MKIHTIEARDLSDLWFQAVNDVQEVGTRHVIDRGSYAGQTRLEFDYFIGHIKDPSYGSGTIEILPQIPEGLGIPNPVDLDYVYGGEEYSRSYVEYVMTATKEENESYTYGQRLTQYPLSDFVMAERYNTNLDLNSEIILNDIGIWDNQNIMPISKERKRFVNQIELIIWTYKNKGHRNNQLVLQIARPDDCLLQDPPCLRHIDTRIQNNEEKELANLIVLAERYLPEWDTDNFEKEELHIEGMRSLIRIVVNKGITELINVEDKIKACEVPELTFVVYFRSWDLWAGLPANLAGIEYLQKYMADAIGVEQGDFIVESKGLHLYGYAEDLAKLRTGKK